MYQYHESPYQLSSLFYMRIFSNDNDVLSDDASSYYTGVKPNSSVLPLYIFFFFWFLYLQSSLISNVFYTNHCLYEVWLQTLSLPFMKAGVLNRWTNKVHYCLFGSCAFLRSAVAARPYSISPFHIVLQ